MFFHSVLKCTNQFGFRLDFSTYGLFCTIGRQKFPTETVCSRKLCFHDLRSVQSRDKFLSTEKIFKQIWLNSWLEKNVEKRYAVALKKKAIFWCTSLVEPDRLCPLKTPSPSLDNVSACHSISKVRNRTRIILVKPDVYKQIIVLWVAGRMMYCVQMDRHIFKCKVAS